MSWARLEDDYASHPKLLAAGLEATGLDARAIAHCSKYGTDGFVGDDEVVVLATPAKRPKAIADKLVGVRRWHRDDEGSGPGCGACSAALEAKADATTAEPGRAGYWLHDFLSYNPSRKEVEGKREAERVRKSSGRKASGRGTDGRWESVGVPPGHPPEIRRTPTAPVPSRPVVHQSSSSDQGVGVAVDEEEDSSLRSEPRPTTDTAIEVIDGQDVAALAVAVKVAQRRMQRRSEPPTSPSRWVATVAGDVLAEHRDRIRSLLVEGHDPATVAAKIDPPAANGTPVVERRECCGTSVTVAHRIGCAVAGEPTWDLDEAGAAVRR